MHDRLIIVLDIGKTVSKLTLWTPAGECVARTTRINERVRTSRYVALDTDGIEAWLAERLARFAALGPVGAIIPVGHGAAAAIVRDGALACPPPDYECPMESADHADYDRQRDGFAETGSPALPDGLNLGAQLHRLERLDPDVLTGDALILPWPQYWAWRLSRIAASEVTSLGCHTDLWCPHTSEPSRLARTRGWADRLAPLKRAAEPLGTVSDEWIQRCGLPTDTIVYCGIHDSNAALVAARGFAELAGEEMTVLSTGTWFVAMRSPGTGAALPNLSESRDCLINVDAEGRLIPSARFMGGRELELLTDGRGIAEPDRQQSLRAASAMVLQRGSRALPSFVVGSGPFPSQQGRWIHKPSDPEECDAAATLYAALVANESLNLIGARDRILIEGRFAAAELFTRALAALRPADRIFLSDAGTDVSFGALRLVLPEVRPADPLRRVIPLEGAVDAYHAQWRADLQQVAA